MIHLSWLWLRNLWRTAAGRLIATAMGIAVATSLLAVLGVFATSAASTMTQRAIANVPVDWQIEIAPGAGVGTVETALSQAGVATEVRQVEYANVDGFSAITGQTQQLTGPGKALGIPLDYFDIFANQVTLLSGSLNGAVLYTQTAANLNVTPGDTITIHRHGLDDVQVQVAGVAALPNIDSLFQAVGVPAGLSPQSPPDNIIILPIDIWHSMFDVQRSALPETVRTQLHVRLDHSLLPADPIGAFTQSSAMGNNLEARVAGNAVVANNLAARLDGVRVDALYARLLFFFVGAPGIVLAGLITIAVADSGERRRQRDQALLRVRGATRREVLWQPAIETIAVGILGASGGVALAFATLGVLGIRSNVAAAWSWALVAAVAGIGLAAVAVLIPAWVGARTVSVSAARRDVATKVRPLWQRLWLDLVFIAASAVIFWQVRGTGYHIVLASEGVAQTSVNYWSFLAPLGLWAGLGLLWLRFTKFGLTSVPRALARTLKPFAGNLSPTVGASLSRQPARIARGAALLALAVGFAASTAVFNHTYDAQARIDAQLTNGSDINVTGPPSDPAGARIDAIRGTPGVSAAEAMMHRYAYVGSDLQDLYGIDPASIGNATALANSFFTGTSATEMLGRLAAQPDGVLVSQETVQDFQLQIGDTLNLRVQSASDNQYHTVPFTFVGIAREFPTAPHDSFLVANASYLAQVSANASYEVVLARSATPSPTVTRLVHSLTDPVLTVTALGDVQSLISSSLTSVDLQTLSQIELGFALALIAVVAGLMLALGFAERQRTFAVLRALGAKPRQLRSFLLSEAAVVTVAGVVFGLVTGFAVAWVLVTTLAGVFDPPPEALSVPVPYLATVFLGALIAATVIVFGFERLHRTDPVAALKRE